MGTISGRNREPGLGNIAAVTERLRALSHPLTGDEDLDPLMDQIGNARYVLLGEASHGTSEYYAWRQRISARLIREKGFSFIAVEGDWPDCYRVNRYIKDYPDPRASAFDVLHAFSRWPTWMWANHEVVRLVEWLHRHNELQTEQNKVGFYGLDVYSLWESMEAVIDYLEHADPAFVPLAKRAYECFEPYRNNAQEYAWMAALTPESCEDDVVAMLRELRNRIPEYPNDGGDSKFNAEQNAIVVRNAERYYRTMIRSNTESWNVRDQHMYETLERLMKHHGPDARAIVWEHNTHIGDARATDMAAAGMFNTGQLVRENHGRGDAALVGFGSHHGHVIAAAEWGAPIRRMAVPVAREGSWEDILNSTEMDNKMVLFGDGALGDALLNPRGHRAIGVVYHPDHEYLGNYVPTVLPNRYDAFLFFNETHALHPLHMEAHPDGDLPETFPWAE